MFDLPEPPKGRFDDEDDSDNVPEPESGDDERTSQSGTVRLIDGAEMAQPLPPLPYVVPAIGMVSGGGAPHLVAGYGFSGKTLALQDLGLSVADGRPAWGANTTTRGRVLHVDFEQGERLTRIRYQRIAAARGIDLAGLRSDLVLAALPPLALTGSYRDAWLRLFEGRSIAIIDSLRAATGGLDENDSAIRGALDLLTGISEQTGCRAIVIHHARKPSGDEAQGRYAIRGSSAIFDACDSAYVFSAEKGEPVRVEHVKARSHGELVGDFALVISDTDVGGRAKAGLSVRLHGAELIDQRRDEAAAAAKSAQARRDAEKVTTALRKKPGLTTTELRAATGLSGSRCTAAVLELGDRVEKRDEKNGRTHAVRHYLRGAP